MAEAHKNAHNGWPSRQWVNQITHQSNRVGALTVPEAAREATMLCEETTLTREVLNGMLDIAA